MFFDFMRTAYQVNESFEDLASTLSANSEIDWSALAKVSLTLENEEKNNKKLQNIQKENKSFQINISKVHLFNLFEFFLYFICSILIRFQKLLMLYKQ